MLRNPLEWLLLAALIALMSGCDDTATSSLGKVGDDCVGNSQCGSGLVCGPQKTCIVVEDVLVDIVADLVNDQTTTSDVDVQTDVQTDVDAAESDGPGCPSDRQCAGSCCEAPNVCFNGACEATCSSGVLCGATQGACCPQGERCQTDGSCASICNPGELACGTGISVRCCAAGAVCLNGSCETDCGSLELCSGQCCTANQMCLGEQCVAQCADASRLCGVQNELCCTTGQVCLSNQCAALGAACTLTEECKLDEYCEPILGYCVPRDLVDVCEFVPPPGVFTPVTACQWRPPSGASDDVVMTPAVANLTDDNGDGVTDTQDIPDIVFTSFDYQTDGCCTARGLLRIISGACNEDGSMNTHYTLPAPFIGNSAGVAIGNLDQDTLLDRRNPEIVAVKQIGGTLALRRVADDGSDWEIMWQNTTYPTNAHTRAGSTPSLADLNGDGAPEVLIGNVVLNGQDGTLIWDGRVTAAAQGFSGGVGNNAFLGPSSTAADVNLDGLMEVIAGNTVYNGVDGSVVCEHTYTTQNSTCQGNIPCDGFTAVGNFDSDYEAEIVIVRRGQVFILEHDCSVKLIVDIPYDDILPYVGDGPCTRNESGPPTIADFDGDGFPEIGTAGADFYVVVDLQCTGTPLPAGCEREYILWKAPNRDCSSRATASSVFDFEGDGKAEVIYADERSFRIFDGTNGNVLFLDSTHRSNTRIEMPLVVDVDNDGKSEVIIPEPNTTSVALGGIEVWEDADNNWVRTRRIWNQHGYHVTNISEDGQVPRVEEPNWLNTRLNNYRQNVQPGGLFDAPDLQVIDLQIDNSTCSAGLLTLTVIVANNGALGVPPGIHIALTARDINTGQTELITVLATTTTLLPTQTETFVLTYSPPLAWGSLNPFVVEASADNDGTGVGQYNECDELNNAFTSAEAISCNIN
ncbi:MAG: hypothetical protein AUK47_10420 [Deltaproteobacteria bacterium CG2_30_63_29]|nr:MAG: hypothetical protein AUK47_10420 [Deltaproteobacteria bacterium CG2_30_63_29]PJB41461.1 MAG: hypothetical protein CO108_13130 [Deltaproteobacteria bacterium CG_4_9_14_3_um_filter_63_12]